jgi:hypothetical protein
MTVVLSLLRTMRASIRTRAALQLEVLALRHQLQVLARTRPRRVPLTRADREGCANSIMPRERTRATSHPNDFVASQIGFAVRPLVRSATVGDRVVAVAVRDEAGVHCSDQ